ncbi:hypothetical protein [Nonomuraea lactucae]|uniref:hypothetical protein n=1 Tax=Nonomuraea lactucae TaxID=2249762 RepID=UPI0013B399A3|nr:hypothetical protein [Nonomuraea lactucae]
MPPRDMNGTTSQHPLSDYVQAYLERTELSARQLARQCVDPQTGHRLLHTYLSALAANEVPRVPDMWRLRALAAGMATDASVRDDSDYRRRLEEIKKVAAIQWLDLGDVLRVDTGGGTWVTVNVPAGLSERRRQRLIKWAEDMARELDQED